MSAKILVVDDEPTMHLLIKKAFRRKVRKGEYEFFFAHNGVEALEQLAEHPDIDVLLTDINMPQMDGLTLLNQLAQRQAETPKAIVLSAYGDLRNIRTAMNQGAFDFLTKPINFEDLEITLTKTLNYVSQLQEARQEKQRAQAAQAELSRQKALRESEQRLVQFLEAVPVGILVIDTEGQPYYTNQFATTLLAGQDAIAQALTGQFAAEHPGLIAAYRADSDQPYPNEAQPLAQALQGNSVTVDDLELHHGDRTIPLEVSATPIYDAQGQVVYAIAALTDITERKRTERLLADYNRTLEAQVEERTEALRASEATNKAMLMAIPDVLIRLNPDGICQDVRQSTVADVLPPINWSVGKSLTEMLSTAVAAEQLQHIQRALQTGQLQVHEYELTETQDEQMHYEEARIVKLQDDEALMMVRDISDRKRAEVALTLAKDAAETANRAKSSFLASMSHELRTPLNAILGFSQLLGGDQSLSGEQRENLQIINRSGEHLLCLINDVLTMSKIESGNETLTLRRFNLPSMLQSLYEMHQVIARKKGLKLTLMAAEDLPLTVQADESKLRQILSNLIGNAVKFTLTGQVTIQANRLTVEGSEHPHLQVIVEDTGPGIAENEIQLLFEPFVQTSSGEKSKEGTGLGLSISREYVQMMDGEITARSQLGVGSTFSIQVPIQVDDSQVGEAPSLMTDYASNMANNAILAAETTTEDIAVTGLSPEDFQNLEMNWVTQLHAAAITIDNQQIATLLDQLPPESQALKNKIIELVEQFRFDLILEGLDTTFPDQFTDYS